MPAMTRRRRTPIRIPPSMLLLLLLLLLAASAAADDQDARGSDRRALLDFKSAVSADPAGLLTRWVGPDHCLWPGVSCAAARVVSLNLSATAPCTSLRLRCPEERRRLSGTLTPALAELSELRALSLPFHRFHGEIPREIWGMRSLEELDLEGSSLSGTLPSQFPVRLAALNLAGNRIAGEIPSSLSKCMDLSILDLSGNRLNGTVPSFLGDFYNLSRLDLSGNLLVGGIPSNIGNCSELRLLLLFSNLLDGQIPSDLGRLTKLQVLDLSGNSLSGRIPAELGNCFELEVLVLLNLYDPLPPKDELSYEGGDEFNYFEGGFPENVALLPNLRVLWAPRAMLEGEIPTNWGACKSLEMVNFGENLFTGLVPFGRCKNLRYLNLSSNSLSGWLDGQHRVPCMDVFDISGNLLSGSIPRFLHRECSLHQFLQDDMASAYYSFFALRSWVGTPFSKFSSTAVYHDFGRNNFSGAVPSFSVGKGRYGNRTVYVFIADGNFLVGSLTDFPLNMCKDSNGLIVNLSNNLISGGLPAEIGNICNGLIVLDVAGNRIVGDIPASFGLLGNLVGLDMSNNRLQGEIPINFKELKGLERLLLAGNNLSGQIPSGLAQLYSLKLLDLSSNYLRGVIPSGLVYLTNLSTLLLNNNMLSGKIPSGISNATSLSMFNVSFNNLSGPLPLNASMMRCDSFLGNPLLQSCHAFSLSIPPSYMEGIIGDSQTNAGDSPPGSPPSNSGKSGFTSIEIASITSAAAIISVLVALIIIYIYTRKCDPRSSSRSPARREVIVFVDIGVPLTYENVVRATGGFNGSNCIGNGGFGATYKAEVSPGVVVAIKRLSIGRFHGIQQFHAEIKTLGRWRHPNLVTLIGYHLSDAEMFLIYNYLPGGNLERFIKERSRRAIDWRMLHKIALDVARALAYLHDHCVPRILHRDVKPSNILLDNDYNAYLSDFGLARLMGNSETHATTGVAGTFGYVAPEYALTCRVSDKADVYSYGVVLLELISDKKALDPSFSPYGHGFNIVTWASVLLQESRAIEFFNQDLWDGGPHDDLAEALNLAIRCTHESLSARPTMRQVVRRLKELQPPTFKHR